MIEEAADEVDGSVQKGEELARPLQRAVRDAMWRFCGVVRDAEGLDRGLAEVDGISESAHGVDVSPNEERWADLGHLFDLRAALLTARATLLGARARRESRGAHGRSDFPNVDSSLRLAFAASRGDAGGPTLTSVPLPDVPDHLRPALETPPAELTGTRLLE